MSSNRYAVAVVGAGVIGAHHCLVVDELREHAELVAVVDLDLGRATALARRYGGLAATSLADVVARVDVDVVAVCTPTGNHCEVVHQALAAGAHVVVEKPAETTLPRIDSLIAARRRSGRLATVISQHRFDPSTETVLAAIGAGRLGRLTSGVASVDWWRGQSYYDSGGWRGTWELDGGGALMNQGIHTVDLLVAALGTPVEVVARTGRLAHHGIEVEDVAAAVVTFAGGAIGIVHASTSAYPGLSARLQVHGDGGSATIDNDDLVYIHTTDPGHTGHGVVMGSNDQGSSNQVDDYALPSMARDAASDPTGLSAAHRYQYENFFAALRGEEDVRVTLEDNRRSVSVVLGAYESARTGLPVRIVEGAAGAVPSGARA